MDRYRRMAMLVAVVEHGSIRRAAGEPASGELVRVLPDWSGPTLSVDVLTPARTRQPAKIRMAVEALRGYLDRASVTRTKASHRNRVTRA